jgi:hypothetical protein
MLKRLSKGVASASRSDQQADLMRFPLPAAPGNLAVHERAFVCSIIFADLASHAAFPSLDERHGIGGLKVGGERRLVAPPLRNEQPSRLCVIDGRVVGNATIPLPRCERKHPQFGGERSNLVRLDVHVPSKNQHNESLSSN